jgi:hypothetical protein
MFLECRAPRSTKCSILARFLHSDGRPDQITSTLHKALDTPGPVPVGVHVDYRQNAKLFEKVYEGSIL